MTLLFGAGPGLKLDLATSSVHVPAHGFESAALAGDEKSPATAIAKAKHAFRLIICFLPKIRSARDLLLFPTE
jgi:hypothetical protein